MVYRSIIMEIKTCIVPICTNSSKTTQNKIFIRVTSNLEERKKWFAAIFGNAAEERFEKTKKNTHLFVCEDHFDLKEDAKNFLEYKTIGKLLLIKVGVVPHKFLTAQSKDDQESQFSFSGKKRKIQHIHNFQCKKRLIFKDEQQPSTSTNTSIERIEPLNTVSSPSGSFNIEIAKDDSVAIFKKPLDESSPSSTSSGASFVPLSTSSSDPVMADCMKDHMKKLNLKVTMYNIEHNSRLFLGIPKEEYFVIKLIEKTRICYKNIMITLKKIRLNDSYARLAILFGMSESMISKIFTGSLTKVAGFFQNLIYFPTKEEILFCVPPQFLPSFKNINSIIDCFEIEIETPTSAKLQAITYSSYKKCNSIKYLISSTPHGFINFISFGFGGRTSDREIVKNSKFIDVLPENSEILADRGFKNLENLINKKNSKLFRPPSVKQTEKMSKRDVMLCKKIAACRIHIERLIRRIREFKMLEPHSTVQHCLIPWLDYVVIIACGIINTQGLLIK